MNTTKIGVPPGMPWLIPPNNEATADTVVFQVDSICEASGEEVVQDVTNDSTESQRGWAYWALKLARNGIKIFPCKNLPGEDENKHPHVPGGFYAATCDEDQIRLWWRWWPDALVAYRTGEATNIAVIDVDPPQGPESLAALMAQHGNLPPCPTVTTQRKGAEHLLFNQWPGLRKSEGVLGLNLDIRAEGSYAIAWQPEKLLEPRPDFPAWAAEILLTAKPSALPVDISSLNEITTPYGQVALNGILAEMRATEEGQRNRTLNRLAFRVGQLVAGGEISWQTAQELKAAALESGLKDREVERTFASDVGHGLEYPASSPETSSHLLPSKRRFSLTHVSEIESLPPDWLVQDYLTMDCLGLIYGDPESGKSFVAVSLAACVASGQQFFGHAVKIGAVVYIAGEGQRGLRRRFDAWAGEYGKSIADLPLYISNVAAPLTDPAALNEVMATIDEIGEKPALIIIDTLARNFGPADENSTSDMNAFVQAIDTLRERYGCATLAVHHTGHANKGRGRGSSVLRGALDFEYQLSSQGNGQRVFNCAKCKDFERPQVMTFQLQTVILDPPGGSPPGLPVSSAVLTLSEYEPPPARCETLNRLAKGKHQTAILEALQKLTSEQAGQEKWISVGTLREQAMGPGMKSKRFSEAFKSLQQRGLITVKGGYVCLVE